MIYLILFFMQFTNCNSNCEEYIKIEYIGDSDKHFPIIKIYDVSDCENKNQRKSYFYFFELEQIEVDSIIKLIDPDVVSQIPKREKIKTFEFGVFRVTYFNKSGDKIIGYLERYKMAKFLNSFYKILNTQTHTGDDKELILGLVDRII